MAQQNPMRGWSLLGATVLVLFSTGVGRMLGMTAVTTLLVRDVPPESDGLAASVGILAGSALGGLTLFVVTRTRAPRAYLALEAPKPAHVAIALAGSALLVVIFDLARHLTTGTIIPPAWITLAESAPAPLLVLAFAVAAPIFEEAFFRGFLHTSLRETRLGVPGAIALTSTLFTLAHGPEDLVSLLDPLASAIFLAVLRERTGSIVPGIAAHAMGNAQAIVIALLA